MAPALSMGVVVARHDEDLSWLHRTQAKLNSTVRRPVHIMVYQTPGRELEPQPPPEAVTAAAALAEEAERAAPPASATERVPGVHFSQRSTPMNRGREAMAYLTAIIDDYNSLPDLTIFLHAHRFSSHTHLMPDWVVQQLVLRPPTDLPHGYMSLQCKEVGSLVCCCSASTHQPPVLKLLGGAHILMWWCWPSWGLPLTATGPQHLA